MAMRVSHHIGKVTLANVLNSLMCAGRCFSPFAASAHEKTLNSRNLLRYYPEIMNCILKFPATDQSFVNNDASIFGWVRPPNMPPRQYATDLIATSCKVSDVYDESTFSVSFIEGFDASIRNVMSKYCAANKGEILVSRSILIIFFIQNSSGKHPTSSYSTTRQTRIPEDQEIVAIQRQS